MTDEVARYCPYFGAAMETLSKRWAGQVLRALVPGPMRFNAMASAIPSLTESTLSQRLKELESAGLVDRAVYCEHPVRVEYALTDKGRALGDVLMQLNGWALEWVTPTNETADTAGDAPPRTSSSTGLVQP
ncbi:helix-turn-helix transcriptional regulator [Nocardioides sp. NBC_00850]|uniref:winged helix-turn-helix transcriptional regulator n=1 Tax=Nocardioides sp. NBC_00850 TaxID=2976001 RepID=UPI003866D9BA|nr:helix-turn-helix transcriptional regulator [Nocardioides sp. NBC_00850]